jgi:hypothetical protein
MLERKQNRLPAHPARFLSFDSHPIIYHLEKPNYDPNCDYLVVPWSFKLDLLDYSSTTS